MSTPAIIKFGGSGIIVARIYRHWDGYPDIMLNDLQRFFQDVENQTNDTRFNDPAYLAAKFVVWQALQNGSDLNKPLDFLSLGVVNEEYDGDYEYIVHSDNLDDNGRPEVTYR